jgi:hypothetical protein
MKNGKPNIFPSILLKKKMAVMSKVNFQYSIVSLFFSNLTPPPAPLQRLLNNASPTPKKPVELETLKWLGALALMQLAKKEDIQQTQDN